jgi:hypothetical protein
MPPNPLKGEQNIQGDEFNLSPFLFISCHSEHSEESVFKLCMSQNRSFVPQDDKKF